AMSIILVISLALGGFILYFRVGAKDYYSASAKAFEIPGLKSGFVPQGFEFDETNGYFLVSGYMKNGSASPLYVVHKNSGDHVKRVTFLNKDGSEYTGHFGGVARYEDFLYVANGTALLVYSYDDVLNPEQTDAIPCLDEISLKSSDSDYVKASFVTVYGNTLITGEFYDGDKYKTLPSHKITTKAGDKNSAIALEFELDTGYPLGIDTVPKKAYSLPNKVQGLCIYDNRIYLSTSYGLAFSHILEYSKTNLTEETSKEFLNTGVTVYSLDSSSLIYDYKIAPMSEEILIIDKELYVMCESASTKYFFGKLIGGKWCYKTNLDQMKG
ncbi:MAG: hypothetical protein IJX16_02745, partial [Clostridia bacterium]|nr:hypothetical protein [Clostridia bacterium]